MLHHLRPIVASGRVARRTLRPPREASAFVGIRVRIPTTRNNNRGLSSSSSSSGPLAGGPGRPMASNSKKPSFEPPPRIKLDPSNELHQKAARAAQLNEELHTLLNEQAERRAEELTKPFGSGFVEFVKKSKKEMINIAAAFFCVLLAYQISSMRSGARKLLDRAEEREATLKELRALLGSLGSEEFAAELSRQCSHALREEGATSAGGQVGLAGGWTWGRGGASRGDSEVDRIADIIRPIVEREIRSIVGDSALSDEEMEEKRLRDLQTEMGVREKSGKSGEDLTPTSEPAELVAVEKKVKDDALGGMEELIVEIQKSGVEGKDGTEIVQRRKFAGSI